jgi:hypothetical protein
MDAHIEVSIICALPSWALVMASMGAVAHTCFSSSAMIANGAWAAQAGLGTVHLAAYWGCATVWGVIV